MYQWDPLLFTKKENKRSQPLCWKINGKVCRAWRRAAVRAQLLARRETRCYFTKLSAAEAILGVGLTATWHFDGNVRSVNVTGRLALAQDLRKLFAFALLAFRSRSHPSHSASRFTMQAQLKCTTCQST